MSRLLIGNDFNEDRAGIADARAKGTGWWSHRILWQALDFDVVVLPVAPDDDYLTYLCRLKGVERDSLAIVVPPAGSGAGVLSPDRLADPSFLGALRSALEGRTVDAVLSLHPDRSIAVLAGAAGVQESLADHAFLMQGGGRFVNSKASFRVVAAGVGAPLPAGGVAYAREEAEALAWALLERGASAMLKHEFRAGGRGNEIVTPVAGLEPVGAQHAVHVETRRELSAYLDRRWDWLSSRNTTATVVEEYHPGSTAVFAEYRLADEVVGLAGQGEMVSAPLAAAEIIPAPVLAEGGLLASLTGPSERMAEALRATGYRGLLSADAIVTPGGDVFFTEYNGRFTGSTHIYGVVGAVLVGPDYATERVLYEREGWAVPTFAGARDALTAAGLAFDPETRRGEVLVMGFNASNNTIRHCAVGKDLADAQELAESAERLFL